MRTQASSSSDEPSEVSVQVSAHGSSIRRQGSEVGMEGDGSRSDEDASEDTDKGTSDKGKGKARSRSEGAGGEVKGQGSMTKASEVGHTTTGSSASLSPGQEEGQVVAEVGYLSNPATTESAYFGTTRSDSTASMAPRPHPIAQTESGSSSPPTPPSKRKRRFSRSISQLSLSSFKSISRPNTPIESPLRSSITMDETQDYFSIETGKGKGKFRQFFRLDSNKVSPRASRPSTPFGDRINTLKEASLLVERIPSRPRSQSAPIPRTSPSLRSESPRLPSPLDQLEQDLQEDTPYHSAVSSPLLPCFTFETAPSSPVLPAKFDLFDHYLPIELQLKVMKALLEVCGEDWRKEAEAGLWKGAKARERWGDGGARGRRELARIGRVSKSWRKLSLDGQLWSTAPSTSLVGADVLSGDSIFELFDQSGPFVKKLDLRGFGKSLEWSGLDRIVQGATAFQVDGMTNFTSINLTGCNSLLSSSITSLLSHSPHLVSLNVFALPHIASTHLETLGHRCPNLTSLNVSRCRILDAKSLPSLFPIPNSALSARGTKARGLKSLKAAALTGMSDDIVFEIFTRNPRLSILDISFSPHLTDDAFKRICQSILPNSEPVQTRKPSLSSSQSTQPLFTTSRLSSPSSPPTLTQAQKRSFPSLQSLNLSGCTSLTSLSLSHLTGLLPSLQTLELSRLPPSFDTSHSLAPFLTSCLSTLRKLDLEDQTELTDETLLSLVGSKRLETLILNTCISLTDSGILEIARTCEGLRQLELDTTEVSDSTAKEFIRLCLERSQSQSQSHSGSSSTPMVLSLLDNRLTGRRLHREIGQSVRPRIGYRGYWTGAAVGFYHDPSDEEEEGGGGGSSGGLSECDESKVVVRSFYSSLAVDAADAVRSLREKREREGIGKEGQRKNRSMSDSQVFTTRDSGRRESLGTSTGCSIM